MLKGRKLIALILTASLFFTVVVAVVGVTIAWYSTKTSQETGLELNANGVMVVFFDNQPIFSATMLKPAVAVKDKITQNTTSFDVLTTNSNVSEAATSVTVTSAFTYLNSSGSDSSAYGLIPAYVTVDAEAKVVFDPDTANEREESISIAEELAIQISAAINYTDTSLTDFNNNVVIGTPFLIDGDATITFTITMYLKKVDDLIDPRILDADKFLVTIGATTDPVEEEE